MRRLGRTNERVCWSVLENGVCMYLNGSNYEILYLKKSLFELLCTNSINVDSIN